MKKTKIIVPAVVLVVVFLIGMFVGIPIGRGSSSGGNSGENDKPATNNGTLTGTVTLAEYLNSGPRVGFYIANTVFDKDMYPDAILLFEDGKMYQVCTWIDENGNLRANDREGREKGALTWSDISKMTDDELLEFARAHKELEWHESSWGYRFNTGEYTLHVYTDSTGNYREYDQIEIEYQSFRNGEWNQPKVGAYPTNRLRELRTKEIYDSIFSGVCMGSSNYASDYDWGLFFRTGSDLTITLDNPGDEGVEVD